MIYGSDKQLRFPQEQGKITEKRMWIFFFFVAFHFFFDIPLSVHNRA